MRDRASALVDLPSIRMELSCSLCRGETERRERLPQVEYRRYCVGGGLGKSKTIQAELAQRPSRGIRNNCSPPTAECKDSEGQNVM